MKKILTILAIGMMGCALQSCTRKPKIISKQQDRFNSALCQYYTFDGWTMDVFTDTCKLYNIGDYQTLNHKP